MAKFCSKCGAELHDGETFCESCGEKIVVRGNRYEEDREIIDILLKTTGRLNRLRYLKRISAVVFIEMIILCLAFMLFATPWGELTALGNVVATVILIGGQVIYYCLSVRRLHDLDNNETLAYILLALGVISVLSNSDPFDMSGFEILACCVEVLGSLYLLFAPGTHGDNKYGPDPLA